MSILIWIVFGAIAGWIASLIMKTDGQQNTLYDIILGIVGSSVGGFLFSLLGQSGVTGFNLSSFLVAIFGSVVVIYIGRQIRR